MDPVLYIVRHGITQYNVERRHLGRKHETPETELNEEGLRQANTLAEMLKTVPFAAIYASKLKRALRTAQIIREANVSFSGGDVRLFIDDRLLELDLGVLEGHVEANARELWPDIYKQRDADKFRYVIPQGQSYAMLTEQIRPFVSEIKALHPDSNVCVVGHQGTNRVLLGLLCGLKPEELTQKEIPHNGVYIVRGSAFNLQFSGQDYKPQQTVSSEL